jgi:hypothetical protein
MHYNCNDLKKIELQYFNRACNKHCTNHSNCGEFNNFLKHSNNNYNCDMIT